jgi:lipid-A-disaccharide synthase
MNGSAHSIGAGRATGSDGPVHVFLVAGEHSGDVLGARLMDAINESRPGGVHFSGVGGPLMEARGFRSLFPITDVAVMGPVAIAAALPRLLARIRTTARAALAAKPDVVVIIDSPEFTHPIAKRIKAQRPDQPVIDYVSPSVWAWRPGRAPRMRAYIDHVLALLPFEPATHERLGGPPCTYVGHPLVERQAEMAASDPAPLAQRLKLSPNRPVLLVLPGSRRSEIGRLMGPFGATMQLLLQQEKLPQVIVATLPAVRPMVEAGLRTWPLIPHIVDDDTDKLRAFKLARAALTASGTVTLELALAGTPMVVAYLVEPLSAPFLRRMIKAPSIVLPNLVLGENMFPEFIQERCTPLALAQAISELMQDGLARAAQLSALAALPSRITLPARSPSEAAAEIVLSYADNRASAR